MEIVLEACSIINLINGELLQHISLIPNMSLYICDTLVEQEILDPAQKLFIETLIINGNVKLLKSDVTLTEFSSLKTLYNLGFGEIECLAFCKKHSYCIASDDFKARAACSKELGKSNVVGTLFLLREAVRNTSLSCEEAVKAYLLMRQKGGFLPNVNNDYLCR